MKAFRASILACILAALAILLMAADHAATGESQVASDTPPQHPVPWSFHPVRDVTPPSVEGSSWVKNPLDAFVLNRLRKEGLSPAPHADRLTLLRRAYYDLIGLPPPPEVVESFAKDGRPDAFEHLIDSLLSSPHYGERWARHWLDVVRYADTGGFENDYLYPNAWKYRDYVIRSFNANKPFDRFIQEQVAGDELWPKDPDAITATDLYCVGPVLEESAMMSNQLEYDWLQDCVDTTGNAFLGLSIGCARCHDHKYDPISQKDYYSFQAIFADSDRPFPSKVRVNRIKALNGLLSDAPVPAHYLKDTPCTVQTEDKTGFHLFHRTDPMEVHRLYRGQVSTPKELMSPAVPEILEQQDPASFSGSSRRSELAQWLTSARNPLAARVLVNRVWAWHFGHGLVRTPNDFGNQGEPPTHPQLLDWLARDFISHGWDLNRLHKMILLSSTYQMQSIGAGAGLQKDPEDKLLWHFPRHRMEGEAIRDGMLACSGTLNPKLFGPPVVPPLGTEELAGLFNAGGKWPVTKDASQYSRRSVYILVRRTFVYPMFATFDAPELMTSCPMRFESTVPTQALTLMNSPLAREQSRAFARRLTRECSGNDQGVVARAFLLAFGRPVTPAEQEHALAFLKERTAALESSDQDASIPPVERGMLPPHAAAVADLCLALFNANEFVYVD